MCENQKPCGSCTQPNCDYRRCEPYHRWLNESWKQFRRYLMHGYRLPKITGPGNFSYLHPGQLRKYLNVGPCWLCPGAGECDLPCAAYWNWWDARMIWLRWKLQNAAAGGAL